LNRDVDEFFGLWRTRKMRGVFHSHHIFTQPRSIHNPNAGINHDCSQRCAKKPTPGRVHRHRRTRHLHRFHAPASAQRRYI